MVSAAYDAVLAGLQAESDRRHGISRFRPSHRARRRRATGRRCSTRPRARRPPTSSCRSPTSSSKTSCSASGRPARTVRRLESTEMTTAKIVRRGALQRRVQRRRAGLPAQQRGRGQARQRRDPRPAAPRRPGAGRSAVGVPLRPERQPLPRAVGPDAARPLHGPAGGAAADCRDPADPRAGDDLRARPTTRRSTSRRSGSGSTRRSAT